MHSDKFLVLLQCVHSILLVTVHFLSVLFMSARVCTYKLVSPRLLRAALTILSSFYLDIVHIFSLFCLQINCTKCGYRRMIDRLFTMSSLLIFPAI